MINKMIRINIFNQNHKLLSACLYDTALCLQKTDFINIYEAEVAIKKIEQALFLSNQLLQREQNLLTALDSNELGLVTILNEFQKEYFIHLQSLNAVLEYYDWSSLPENKTETGNLITRSFLKLMVTLIELMDKKESDINTRLWNNYSDCQLITLLKNISGTIAEEQLIAESKMVINSINNQEVVNWLMLLKDCASNRIFNSVLEMLEQQLPAWRWNQIQPKITEGVSVF
jgi:hypothetical protein